MRLKFVFTIVILVVAAVVIQTTLFGRLQVVTPDLVMLLTMLFALTRLRAELVLGLAFASGLIVDLLGSSLLGLRAMVFTVVAYAALRTRERAEIGRIATVLWVGFLTLMGVVLLVLIGTLFGDATLLGDGALGRVFGVPLVNMAVAALVAPSVVRLINGDRSSFRYA